MTGGEQPTLCEQIERAAEQQFGDRLREPVLRAQVDLVAASVERVMAEPLEPHALAPYVNG